MDERRTAIQEPPNEKSPHMTRHLRADISIVAIPGTKVLKTVIPTTSEALDIPGLTCSHEPNTPQVDTASRALISFYHGEVFLVSYRFAKVVRVSGQQWWELRERPTLGGSSMCCAPLHHSVDGSRVANEKINLQWIVVMLCPFLPKQLIVTKCMNEGTTMCLIRHRPLLSLSARGAFRQEQCSQGSPYLAV
jgi:hypothetical protein